MIFRIVRWLALLIAYLVGVFLALWAAGALYFDLPAPSAFRIAAAVIWLCVAAAAWWGLGSRWPARLGIALCFGAILGWWCTLRPRQDRDWKPEVALLSHATIEGDRLIVSNVRNFDYRRGTDFTPRYETRSYDLNTLKALDVIVSKWKWSSGILGHPMLSFYFGTGDHLAFTIEIRPEKDESFSPLPALYRRFELIYIPADERDVIGARATFRPEEDLYLYRVRVPSDRLRETLLEYVARLNQLQRQPEWYNLITANCTSSIRTQRAAGKRLPWDIRILINGYVDEMLYDRGALDRSLPFSELERSSRINEQARAAYRAPDFSERIRAGLPGIPSN